ncbi:hypothetical protein HYV49_04255 [Candidatus Pacearchaeota archaeon]|nr:hypothetical protein [Candidatus Pacearchaeota archaeon]
MGFKERYEKAKNELLCDKMICRENRDVFRQFFQFEEHKLKRQNGLPALDEPCYKTLIYYVQRFRNVNSWFKNKPWKDLTKEDIKKVYDDLEEGRIRNKKGERFADRSSYYNKVFKSKPFKLAGKDELAREVIEFSSNPRKEVSFVSEETFLKMVSVLSKPSHLLLFWLAWDVGENINTLLQLTKKDFTRQVNEDTREVEYLVNLPREKLKRSRQSRSEPTLYPETAKYADIVLPGLNENDCVFRFGYRQALKLMHSVARKTGASCVPTNTRVSWKDLRSGMACHLLRSGWTTDEVNFRLGHKPSSKEIDAYVSYLAIDRRKPKKKLFDSNLQRIEGELQQAKQRERLLVDRLRRQGEDNQSLRFDLDQTRKDLGELKKRIEQVMQQV